MVDIDITEQLDQLAGARYQAADVYQAGVAERARTEIEQLRLDTKRLDWIDTAMDAELRVGEGAMSDRFLRWGRYHDHLVDAAPIREAIDRAMETDAVGTEKGNDDG